MIATWMTYTLLVSACAALAAAACEPMFAARQLPRRVPWIAALAAAVVTPLLVAIRPAVVAPTAMESLAALPTAATGPMAATVIAPDWDVLLLAAWALASLAWAALVARGMWQLHRAARQAQRVTVDGEPVALTRDAGPGVRFFGSPRILVPAWLASLDRPRQSLLIRHEREHLRARDPMLLASSLAAVGAMPWNPLVWLISRRLRAALELDCDARVLAAGGDVRAYGHLLLTVAASQRPPRLPAYLAFASSRSPLHRRIRAMTNPRPSLGATAQCGLVLAVAASVVTACEARRPEPLAPVASYTIADGVATPAPATTASQEDSTRSAISSALRLHGPSFGASGTTEDPLVMIHDAEGNVVMTGRLRARSANGTPAFDSIPVPASEIARVDVRKRSPLLPPEAKGGLIRIDLKPAASSANAPPTSALTPATSARADGAIGTRSDATAPSRALVVVRSDDGKELYRKVLSLTPATGAASPFDGLPVVSEDIATMDVIKPRGAGADPAQASIIITLKPGRSVSSGR